jgi:hypothetical protein
VLLLVPGIVTLLALGDNWLFSGLNLLNAAAFGWIYLRNRRWRWVAYLAVVSLAAGLGIAPERLVGFLLPEFSRGVWILCCLGSVIFCLAAASRDPRSALLGAILALAAAHFVLARVEASWNPGIAVGTVFVLAHSLRWIDERHRGARLARILFAAGWILHSFFWAISSQRFAPIMVYSLAALLFVLYGIHRYFSGFWASRYVPCAASLVCLAWPARRLIENLQTTSPGFLAVATAFWLFALGTIAAFTKHLWNKRVQQE